MADKRVTQVLS